MVDQLQWIVDSCASLLEDHARQRARRHRPRGSPRAARGGERLVPRRIEERSAGPDGPRASVRAPDVRRLRAPAARLLRAAAGSRRVAQRIDQHGSHELLGGRAEEAARAGAVDGSRSDGLAAAGADRGALRDPARRRAQRAPPELREPAVRPRAVRAARRDVSGRPSVSLADDWRTRRSAAPRRPTTRARSSRATTIRATRRCASPATSRPARRSIWRRAVSARFRRGRRSRRSTSPRRWPGRAGSCSRIASSCRGCIWPGRRRRSSPRRRGAGSGRGSARQRPHVAPVRAADARARDRDGTCGRQASRELGSTSRSSRRRRPATRSRSSKRRSLAS